MLKKLLIVIVVISMVASFNGFISSCYAAVEITEENLINAFNSYVTEMEEEGEISVSNGIIEMKLEEQKAAFKYDLSGSKPKFFYEMLVEKGMSYETFEKESENLNFPIMGYVAVANIQGVGIKDATAYIALTYLENAFKNMNTSIVVMNDTEESVTSSTNENNTNVYLVSEFPNRVIEYVNALYPETQKISDAEKMNSYEMIIEKKDVTETSCKLVATLTVNTEANFSQLNGMAEQMENSFQDAFTDSSINSETADYVLELKVGQKCAIKPKEKFRGYSSSGGSADIDRENAEIVGVKEGVTTGHLYIGEEEKTIYINVVSNISGEELKTLVLNLDKPGDITEEPSEESKDENVNYQEETEKQEDINNNNDNNDDLQLPQSGIDNKIIIAIVIAFIISLIMGFKTIKNRDI